MNRSETRVLLGLLLILGGSIFLIANLNFYSLDNIWPLLLGLPALVFIYIFLRDKQSWWAAIPGFTLLGLASTLIMEHTFRHSWLGWVGRVIAEASGSLLFAGIGLGFIAIYLRTALREWWAIIPGGVLLTLATVTFSAPFVHSGIEGAIFMLGLSLTFGLVYLIPTPKGRMRWAIIPAGILFIIGILGILANTTLLNFVWPVALILLGVYILVKGFRPRR